MAMLALSDAAFKMWIDFALNANNFEFALSYERFHHNFGMSKKHFHSAVNELKEKGFLVLRDQNLPEKLQSKVHYEFYEISNIKKYRDHWSLMDMAHEA